jgi:predicted O-linked N-acetylglucosamine transferase (SPINDLY family)
MNNIYLVFEIINLDFIKKIEYYFRDYNYKIIKLSELPKFKNNLEQVILFKSNCLPFINFSTNIKTLTNTTNTTNYDLCWLNSNKTIFYIAKNNWVFEQNDKNQLTFVILKASEDTLSMFDTTDNYNIELHQAYKNIGENYKLLYNIYNNLNNLEYRQIYNKNLSLKSIQDFCKIESITDTFFNVIIILTENNVKLFNQIITQLETQTYKNARYFVMTMNFDVKLKISKHHNIIHVNLSNNLNLIYQIVLNLGLVFEQIIFLTLNQMVDLNVIDSRIKKTKVIFDNEFITMPLNVFVTNAFFMSHNEKLFDINQFYNLINWHIFDCVKSVDINICKEILSKYSRYINNLPRYSIPLNYKFQEKALLNIKDYEGLLVLIDNEININYDLTKVNELIIKKITISILTEKEDMLQNNMVNILTHFVDVHILETVSLLIERTKFVDVKKTLYTKILSKLEINESTLSKFHITLVKALQLMQTKENIITICDSLSKNELYIDKIKVNEQFKKQILFLLLSQTLNYTDDDSIINAVSNIFNKMYNLENLKDFNNLLKYDFGQYNIIFINFLLSIAISFNPYHKTFNEFIENRKTIYNNLLSIKNKINNQINLTQVMAFKIGNFNLSYQGVPSVEIFKLKSEILRKLCPDLNYQINTNYTNKKIKVLFHGSQLTRQHSVYKDRHQVIKQLSLDNRFQIYFSTFDNLDSSVKYTFGNAKHILLSRKLTEIKERLIKEQFDIIVYCEIGMDSISYFMAHLKLAKIQCNTWGHSDTSGISSIDYFFSSKLYELPYEESQQHYSEKLILQNSLCTSYISPISRHNKALFKARSHFGFTNDIVIYFCAQSLFKLNPLFDEYIIGILSQIPNAVLILLESADKSKVIERFNDFGIGHKIKFFNGMDHFTYMNLINISDIFLDVYPFGGCNSSFEAFSLGKPIVTQPSQMINGRFTTGFYKKMNLEKYISNTTKEYIDFAVKLGLDIAYRKLVEIDINSNNSCLFLDEETITEWKNDLIKIYDNYK